MASIVIITGRTGLDGKSFDRVAGCRAGCFSALAGSTATLNAGCGDADVGYGAVE